MQALSTDQAVGARFSQAILADRLTIANQGCGARTIELAILGKPFPMLMREFSGDQVLMVVVYLFDIAEYVDALDG